MKKVILIFYLICFFLIIACGGSYAFTTVDSLQQRFCAVSGGDINVKLSAQDIISCDKNDYGCDGGEIIYVWMYTSDYGVVDENCFPFSSEHGEVEECITECKDGTEWYKYKAADYKFAFNIEAMKSAIAERGPINSYFTVYEDFMNYKGGIYQHTEGEEVGGRYGNIVGFGNEGIMHFWIVQITLGPEWGESGYVRMKFGECGIDYEAMVANPLIE